MRQSVNNRNSFGYTSVTSDVAMTSKTVFVKGSATTPNHLVFGKTFKPTVTTTPNHLVFGKTFKPALPKIKRFVRTCYFYNMPGHIHPRCYKYIKFLRMRRNEKPFYASRTTHKIKVELDNKLSNRL